MKMKQSLVGLLLNSSDALKRREPGLAFGLRTLLDNLRQVRDRHRAGDAAVVDEFFDAYVLDSPPESSSGEVRPSHKRDVWPEAP